MTAPTTTPPPATDRKCRAFLGMWPLGAVEGQIFTGGGPGFWDIGVQIDFLVFDGATPLYKNFVPPRALPSMEIAIPASFKTCVKASKVLGRR